jgi:hypothetical protein
MQPMDTSAPTRGYRLVGRFLEACDCYAICPCWIDEPPDDGKCSGVYAWEINNGRIAGVDVSGLKIASVSFHQGRRRGSRQRVVLIIDKRADAMQREALTAVFSGQRGGPLGELGAMLGTLTGTRYSKIEIDWSDTRPAIKIGKRVAVTAEPKVGPSKRNTALTDSAMSTTLGPHAVVGLSTEFRLALGEEGMDIEVKGRSANLGWFSYTA